MVFTLVRRAVTSALDASGVVTRTQLHMGLRDLAARLERKIVMTAANAENELFERLATRIGVMIAEGVSLRQTIAEKDAALNAALAERDALAANTAQQIEAALALDAQADAARLEELLRQAGVEVPAPVPPVEVPPAGEPATPPADGPAVEPVDEGALPTTDPTTPDVEPVPSDPAASTDEGAVPAVGEMTDPGEAGSAGEAGDNSSSTEPTQL